MSNEHAEAFVDKVGQDAELAQKLAAIREGDWQAVIDLGAAAGYEFSRAEIQAAIPEEFYREHPQSNPRLSWSRRTLENQ
jgi:predicted ribosomally synthesized peptide with nif11-like leader